MKYDNCPLYKVQSKRYLQQLLHMSSHFFKQKYVSSQVSPYIDTTGKPRLIECPSVELKKIQKSIKNYLSVIEVPNNVFSGIKGRSYYDNAKMHIGSKKRNLYKIDLTAFFPSISRDKVYRFFLYDLGCSPDVAEILTSLTTFDVDKAQSNKPEILSFLESKNCNTLNHLISGAPTSQIMSYLVNHDMFDEMQEIADKNNIMMTIYVDDVTFSSERNISSAFRNRIKRIVKKYHFQISNKKVKHYTRNYTKLVTGVVISSKGKAIVKNSLRKKIIDEFNYLKNHEEDNNSRRRLRGLLTAARQVDPTIFPNIYSFAFKPFYEEE